MDFISASSPLEGNTNPKARNKEAKRYCFTYNNYDINIIDKLKDTLNKLGKYIFGFEVGDSGTPHLQGYINLHNKKTLSSLKNHINIRQIHFEKCKGSENDNIRYCSKDNKYISNFIEQPYIEDIVNLYPWELKINTIIESIPDKRTIYYFYEDEGCKGKTTYQKYIYSHYKGTVILSGKGADMKNGIITYYNINRSLPKIILINIPRDSFSFISWATIEELKDMFFYSGKYEGGMICGKPPHILIFSNEPPPINKFSKDRWRIYNINNNDLIEEQLREIVIDESSI